MRRSKKVSFGRGTEISLLRLLFGSQRHRKSPRSRIRTTPDGREILRGAAYERRRKKVLERDGGRCVLCNSTYEVEVHHRTKRSILRDDWAENLVSLCEGCHRREHQEG